VSESLSSNEASQASPSGQARFAKRQPILSAMPFALAQTASRATDNAVARSEWTGAVHAATHRSNVIGRVGQVEQSRAIIARPTVCCPHWASRRGSNAATSPAGSCLHRGANSIQVPR